MSYPHHASPDALPPEVALDRAAARFATRDTYGAAAMHGLDPFEIVARLEETRLDPAAAAQFDREALRKEIFSGYIEYIFCDGPDPECVRRRIDGFLQSLAPEVHERITGPLHWVSATAVRTILRAPIYRAKLRALRTSHPAALSTWCLQLDREIDQHWVARTISEIVKFAISQGANWKALVAVAYCMAKSFHPHLLAGMSLEHIAVLSGDEGGRATPSDRARRLYNRRVAESGAKATSVPFQKSASTVLKYAAAQQGNHNRKKTKRSPKP